jgi:putative DNA primase/helicase
MDDAAAALKLIRSAFATLPFADAPLVEGEVPTIDLSRAPGHDESAFLAGLLTAACRPSLTLAPGLPIVAPALSGAGTGKGLLVRAIAAIAFGVSPRAFTMGRDIAELDKRLASALMDAASVLFLDNVNATNLRSDLLASVLSEPNVDIRPLGVSRMVRLNSTAFVAVTGNGLRLSEDLTRRFIMCELDAKTEDPEGRSFAPGFPEAIKCRRLRLAGHWAATKIGPAGYAIRSWRLGAPIRSSAFPDRRPTILSAGASPRSLTSGKLITRIGP